MALHKQIDHDYDSAIVITNGNEIAAAILVLAQVISETEFTPDLRQLTVEVAEAIKALRSRTW